MRDVKRAVIGEIEVCFRVVILGKLVVDIGATAEAGYRLRDLGESAWHDCGGILDDFEEIVLVSLTDRLVLLIVMAGD